MKTHLVIELAIIDGFDHIANFTFLMVHHIQWLSDLMFINYFDSIDSYFGFEYSDSHASCFKCLCSPIHVCCLAGNADLVLHCSLKIWICFKLVNHLR